MGNIFFFFCPLTYPLLEYLGFTKMRFNNMDQSSIWGKGRGHNLYTSFLQTMRQDIQNLHMPELCSHLLFK